MGRFSQADTIIPGVGNPISWDRYAFVINNPLKYVDPTGNNFECGPDGIWCDDYPENDDDYPPLDPGELGEPLEEWEIQLLIAAVMAETSNGTQPEEIIIMITWIFLNRISLTYDDLWEAVKGDQSAFCTYYGGCTNSDDPPVFKEMGELNIKEYIGNLWEWKTDTAWEGVTNIVLEEYNKWLSWGTGSSADPTGFGATDFRMKYPADQTEETAKKMNTSVDQISMENALKVYPFYEKDYPGYIYGYSGPFDMLGYTGLFLFYDNRLITMIIK